MTCIIICKFYQIMHVVHLRFYSYYPENILGVEFVLLSFHERRYQKVKLM